MTVNTIMAMYTAVFGIVIAGLTVEYFSKENYVMGILGLVALYGIVETVTKYYYVRKAVMEEIEARGGDNVDRK